VYPHHDDARPDRVLAGLRKWARYPGRATRLKIEHDALYESHILEAVRTHERDDERLERVGQELMRFWPDDQVRAAVDNAIRWGAAFTAAHTATDLAFAGEVSYDAAYTTELITTILAAYIAARITRSRSQ
jgi:hypothetical protein